MAQATAQGFKRPELEPWAFVSLDDGPTRPGFGTAGPGWLTALSWAQHITKKDASWALGRDCSNLALTEVGIEVA